MSARAVRRAGLLVRAVVCVGVLGAGCASDSSEQAPAASAPSSDALAPTTLPPPEQASGSTGKPAPADEPPARDEPSQPDEPAEPDEPDEVAAAGESSGDVAVPEPAQDEPPGEASVFPPVGEGNGVARWTVEIVESFPHDPEAFTQGLEVAGGTMYESTGLWGRSSLRTVNSATGEIVARTDLSDGLFGEGLTVVGDRVLQLTWQSGTALVYDRSSLEVVGEQSYEGEGWGLCLSDDVLIMSDGSDRLARRDPLTFELLGTVTVAASGYDGRLDHLNELECVEGLVVANVWQTDRLLVIDPVSGRVVAAIDAGPLVDDVSRNALGDIDVLNGVAVDESAGTLWMTGKLWPRLYRVRIVEVPQEAERMD